MSFDLALNDDMHTDGFVIGVTTDVEVLAAPAAYNVVVMDCVLVNVSGATVDVILKWNDGATDFHLIDETLAANSSVNMPLEYLLLFPTNTLVVNCSVVNVVHVSVSYSDVTPQGGAT